MINRRYVATAVAILALLGALPARGAAQLAQWKEFRSTDGKFAVRMPGEPAFEKKATTAELEMKVYTLQTGDMLYSVVYYDISAAAHADNEKFLDDTCDAFVRGANLTEKAERRTIDLAGHSGRELMGEAPDGSFLLIARYFVVGDRVYLVMAGAAVENAAAPEIGEYLNSFRLLA